MEPPFGDDEAGGAGQAGTPASPAARKELSGVVRVGSSGQVIVPADVLAGAGIGPDDDVVVEATADGVRVARDAMRKVYVESASRCNLDCSMCVRHGWQEPLGCMPADRFERLVDGLPRGAGEVTLAFGGFGEPLVHPEWRSLLGSACARSLRVEVITNGVLLNAEAAAAMTDLGVSQVTVSIDGGDAGTYARMRGVPSSDALAAVHHLRDARPRSRRPPAIGVAAVATRSSVASLPALLEWASDLKLDFVSIGNLVPHTEEMASETLWERAGWASVFRASSWRPQVRVGRFDMEEATRPLAAALAERGLTYPSPSIDAAHWRNRCRFAHEGICAVSWDGRVTPCLSLLHSHTEFINSQARRIDEFVVGHIDRQPLSEIWKEPAFLEFRRRVRAFDFPPCFHCGGCPLTETNREDCYGNPAPVCGECLWAQGIVLCP
jgi:MoaA/NifB/PqqE/SkfB family radical SAM enzyme